MRSVFAKKGRKYYLKKIMQKKVAKKAYWLYFEYTPGMPFFYPFFVLVPFLYEIKISPKNFFMRLFFLHENQNFHLKYLFFNKNCKFCYKNACFLRKLLNLYKNTFFCKCAFFYLCLFCTNF